MLTQPMLCVLGTKTSNKAVKGGFFLSKKVFSYSAAGLGLLYGGPLRQCYAGPLLVATVPPLLRGLMARYRGC